MFSLERNAKYNPTLYVSSRLRETTNLKPLRSSPMAFRTLRCNLPYALWLKACDPNSEKTMCVMNAKGCRVLIRPKGGGEPWMMGRAMEIEEFLIEGSARRHAVHGNCCEHRHLAADQSAVGELRVDLL